MKYYTSLFIALLIIIPNSFVHSQKIKASVDSKIGFITDLGSKGLIISRHPNGYVLPTCKYFDGDLKLQWEKRSSGSFFQPENEKFLFLVEKYKPQPWEPTVKSMEVSVVEYNGEQSQIKVVKTPSKMFIYQVFATDSTLNILYKNKSNFQKHKSNVSETIKWRTISSNLIITDTNIVVVAPSFKKFEEQFNYWKFKGYSENEIFFSALYQNKDEDYKSELLTIGIEGKITITKVKGGRTSFSRKGRLFFVNSISPYFDEFKMTCISPEGGVNWVTETRLKTPLKKWDWGSSDFLTFQYPMDNGYLAFVFKLWDEKEGSMTFLFDVEDGDRVFDKDFGGTFAQNSSVKVDGIGMSWLIHYFSNSVALSILKENADDLIKPSSYYGGNFYYSIRENSELLIMFLKNETSMFIF